MSRRFSHKATRFRATSTYRPDPSQDGSDEQMYGAKEQVPLAG